MSDYNIEAYKRLHNGDCPNCKELRSELDRKNELLRQRHLLEESQTEAIRTLKAELQLSQRKVVDLCAGQIRDGAAFAVEADAEIRKLQAELEAANKKIIVLEAARMGDAFAISNAAKYLQTKDKVIENMAADILSATGLRERPSLASLIKSYYARAECSEGKG